MGKHKERGGESIRYPKDDCNKCGKLSPMTPDNTRYETYTGYPLSDHFFTVCVHCEQATRIFAKSDKRDVEHMGYYIYERSMPDPDLIYSTNRAHGIEDIQCHELDEHEEAQAQFAHFIMENVIDIGDL